MSLERALSKLGLATRREAHELILAGRVSIDGRQARDPGLPVVPERIAVTIDGFAQQAADTAITIALHKPRGVVTTRRDPEGRPTVYDLLDGLDAHVVPVGRLDLATSGLLLLTNDTRFADWLTDPANAVPRVYLVTVRGRFTPEKASAIARGLHDGGDWLQAQSIAIRKASGRESHLVIELAEGKNREIRRLLAAVDHEVIRLRRVQIGGLTLDDLPPGAWRYVSDDELVRAFPTRPTRPTRAT